MSDKKMIDHRNAGHEIDGHENLGHENGRRVSSRRICLDWVDFGLASLPATVYFLDSNNVQDQRSDQLV